MRLPLGLSIVSLVALAALGLVFSASRTPRADFTFVNLSEPKTLDPASLTGVTGGRIVSALFEGLTQRDPETLRPMPGVAQSWEVSEDGLVWTFQLREDARWSDGRPVTAHDFAWSWRRLQEPAQGAEYAYILHVVRLAEAFNTYAGHAEALRGPILRGFDALREAHPEGVDAETWRRFLVRSDAFGPLKGVPDPLLAGALSARTGIAPEDWAPLREALVAEAARRAKLAVTASTHFGVDRGVFARDARTLVVELVSPTPYFLELTAFTPSFPVPRHVVEAPRNAHDWFLPGKIVSNGPFELAAWRVGDRIRLRRSPSYWDRERISLETVDALPVENTTTALNLYLTDGADWIPDYPSDLAEILRERPDHHLGPALTTYYYRVNTRRPPLDDPRVRRALALAIDRDTIVRDVLQLGQLPAHHLVPPGLVGYEPPVSPITFDPAAARALLAEAGFPAGRGMRELGLLYNTLESHKKIAEVVADQLKRNLGIRVVPYNQEWQAYLATILEGDYDLARAGWVGDYLDPNTFLDLWVTDGGNNQTGWSDPVYDQLIAAAGDVSRFIGDPALAGSLREPSVVLALRDAALGSEDPVLRRATQAKLRMQLLREAEAILMERGLPVLPLYFYVNANLVKPWVEGFHSNLLNVHPLRGMRVGQRP